MPFKKAFSFSLYDLVCWGPGAALEIIFLLLLTGSSDVDFLLSGIGLSLLDYLNPGLWALGYSAWTELTLFKLFTTVLVLFMALEFLDISLEEIMI